MSDFNQAVQSNVAARPPQMPSPAPALTPVPPQMPQPIQTPGDYGLPGNHINPYGGNPVPNADIPANNNNDQLAKVPNLQSNMFKMQRNKSELGRSEWLTYWIHSKPIHFLIDSFEKVLRRCIQSIWSTIKANRTNPGSNYSHGYTTKWVLCASTGSK